MIRSIGVTAAGTAVAVLGAVVTTFMAGTSFAQAEPPM